MKKKNLLQKMKMKLKKIIYKEKCSYRKKLNNIQSRKPIIYIIKINKKVRIGQII